jgi:hypothetical protein
MAFWHVYMGIEGAGASADLVRSVYKAILNSVVDAIKALDLTDIADDNVILCKVPQERETVMPGLPGVLVYPLGREMMTATAGTNCRDDIGYPVAVMMLDAERLDQSTLEPVAGDATTPDGGTQDQDFRYDLKLYWRETIRKRFYHQRLDVSAYKSDGWVHDCLMEPEAIVEAKDFLEANIWVSVLVFRFMSRETRG